MNRLKYFALAALVAFAACDEGDEVVVPEPVTGSITGTVTVDGTGQAGVTVTLSSGTTATTATNGSFTFSDVEAGAYTVSISGTPSDAAFSFTSAPAVLTTAGQVINISFEGSFIRTSAISASVAAPGIGALVNATVSLSGQSSASQTTGTSGTVTFSGLRAGDYTVAVALSSADALLYDLDTASVNVTLDVDELEAVAFTATPKTISTISGTLFIDELPKNDAFETTAEEAVAAANIQLIIEGVSVGVFDTIQTAADGTFELSMLPAANYRIILNTSDSDIPGALAFGGTNNAPVITLGVADSEIVNFPFDIVEQKVTVGAFLGIDGTSSARTTPLPGAGVRIYPTEALASALGGGFIGSGTTGANGEVTIDFDRADDFQPGSSNSDNIVFAAIPGALAFLGQNGENVIEIPFAAPDSLVTAVDEFDYTSTQTTVAFMVQEIDGDTYQNVGTRITQDTTSPLPATVADTDANGMVYFDITAAGDYWVRTRPNLWPNYVADAAIPFPPNGVLPLSYPFSESFDAGSASVDGSWLNFEFNGLNLPTDTVMLGTGNLTWDNVRLRGRAYREWNDVQDFQAGVDPLTGVAVMNVQLQRDSAGTWVNVGLPIVPPNLSGAFGNGGVPSGESYRYTANTANTVPSTDWAVLDDTTVDFMADGSDQGFDICPLRDAGTTTYPTCGTFAVKSQNNTISGTILYRDGSPVPNGTEVMISVIPDSTIQGRASSNGDTVVTVAGGAGLFTSNASVREGYYKVTPVTDEPAVFFAETTNGDAKDTEIQGAMVMDVLPDLSGFNTVTDAAFHAHRTDGSIRGYVVNDRDQDGNTIDVNEALIGATVTLYADDGLGGVTTSADSIIGTATVGTDGLYEFEDLVTRRYIVTAESPGDEVVIAQGSTTPRYSITPDNLDIEVNPAPTAALPFWDYATSTLATAGEAGEQNSYFTFLFQNGTVNGQITNDVGGSAISGITLQITPCITSATPTVPTAGECTTGGVVSFIQTDATGTFQVADLREGVYEITIVPGSAGDGDGPFTDVLFGGVNIAGDNNSVIVLVDDNLDLETANFTVTN